jgi:hypothetical protein
MSLQHGQNAPMLCAPPAAGPGVPLQTAAWHQVREQRRRGAHGQQAAQAVCSRHESSAALQRALCCSGKPLVKPLGQVAPTWSSEKSVARPSGGGTNTPTTTRQSRVVLWLSSTGARTWSSVNSVARASGGGTVLAVLQTVWVRDRSEPCRGGKII